MTGILKSLIKEVKMLWIGIIIGVIMTAIFLEGFRGAHLLNEKEETNES
jgi:hypothetical protein